MTTTFSIGASGEVKVAPADFKGLEAIPLTRFGDETKGIMTDRVKGRAALEYKRYYDSAMAQLDPMSFIKNSLTAKRAAMESEQKAITAFIEAQQTAGKTAEEAEMNAMRFSHALGFAGNLEAELVAPSGQVATAWSVQTKGARAPRARKPKRKAGGKRKAKGKK